MKSLPLTTLNVDGADVGSGEVILGIDGRSATGTMTCDSVKILTGQSYESCELRGEGTQWEGLYLWFTDSYPLNGEIEITFDIQLPTLPLTVWTDAQNPNIGLAEQVMEIIMEEDLANAPATVTDTSDSSSRNTENLAETGASGIIALVGVAFVLITVGVLVPAVRQKDC